jgi:hypothetical protein
MKSVVAEIVEKRDAEIARLRAALEKIAGRRQEDAEDWADIPGDKTLHEMIAIRALDYKPKGHQ